ncbi:MAG: MFS transporter [Chitinophagaceae bacterium]|nr:MAG: MFS transporter [Chitinophagaceae bacterium]
MRYNRNLVFIASCAGMLLFGIVFLSLGTVLTFVRQQYGLSELQAGSLTALLPFGILAGSIVFGPVVDRYGYKYVLIFSTFIIFLAFEGIAYAGSLLILQIAFLLIGFGGGIINGATNALVSDISSASKGANLSLLGVFYGIGAVGMPFLLGVLSNKFAYASIIAGIGIFVLLPFIFFFIVQFPVSKNKHGTSLKETGRLFSTVLLLLGFVLFFESAVEGIANNWATSFALSVVTPENSFALMALTLSNIALVISRLLLGILLVKVKPYRMLYFCWSCVLIGSLIMYFVHTVAGLYLGMALIGFGFGAGFPVILGYVGELNPGFTGTAFGVVITIALIGNTLINGLTGVVSQRFGVNYFPLVIVACVIAMMIIFAVVFQKMKLKIQAGKEIKEALT